MEPVNNSRIRTMSMSPVEAPATPCKHPGSTKNKWVAVLLAFFLGGLGAHKFYLRKPGWGVVYLLFCWTSIPSLVAFIEMLVYLFTSESDFAAKYNR